MPSPSSDSRRESNSLVALGVACFRLLGLPCAGKSALLSARGICPRGPGISGAGSIVANAGTSRRAFRASS
eukprot:8817868-Pyramimonas_sp.AAC.1